MIKFIEKHKSEVIIALIVGFVSSLINDPIRHFLGNMGNGLIISIFDYFYYCCANSSPTTFVNRFSYSAFIFASLSFFSAAKVLLFPYKGKQATDDFTLKYNKLEEKSAILIQQIKQKVDYSLIKKQMIDLENEYMDLENKKLRKEKRDRTISIVILIILMFFFIYEIGYTYVPSVYKENFDRTITKIRPYIEDRQVNQLNSDWVSMKTQQDYLILKEKISEIEEKYNLK